VIVSTTPRRRRLPRGAPALGLAGALWALASLLSASIGGGVPPESAPRGETAVLAGASFFLGGFRSLVADAIWLRAETAGPAWERRHETLSAYRLMASLDPDNDSLRAFLVKRLAIDLPAREADEERRREWIREALALGEESAALSPGSAAIASELAVAYLVACRGDATLAREVPRAARRARELFERARDLGGADGAEAAFAATVAAAAEGRDALEAGDYPAALTAFEAGGEGLAPWRRFAAALESGDAGAVRASVAELSRSAAPADRDLVARIAARALRGPGG